MRKIKNSEIKEAAQIMAECFSDYPVYSVFFRNDRRKQKRIFYFFWYRLYTRREFTWVTPEMNLIVSVRKPEDPIRSSLGLWLDLRFLFGFLCNIPLRSLLLVREFGKMETTFWDRFYNPLTDCYAQAICVRKSSRGSGEIFRALKEMEDGRPIYCETHTEENVKLYELMGLEVCGKTEWHGVTHYAMKKRGDYIRLSGPLSVQKTKR